MKKIIIVFIIILLTTDCSDNSTFPNSEKVIRELKIFNMESIAIADTIINSDSTSIKFKYSFDYKFENCYGSIDIFRVHLPFNKYYYGEIMGVFCQTDQNYHHKDSTFLITNKEVPKNYTQQIDIEGVTYLKVETGWEEVEKYKSSVTNLVEIEKRY